MKITSVTVADCKELLAIYGSYVRDTAISFEYEIPSEEEFAERIRSISAKYPYIKAVDDTGKILGYAYAGTFKSRSAYDWSVETTIYLHPDCKRQGIGKALYLELENRLREMGILNMNACIALPKVEDTHLTFDSVRFHEALGFTPVGVFHDSGLKFDTWYDMIWMEKMIGPHDRVPQPVRFGK